MTYRGLVKNGTVLLEEPVHLPEGAEVRVELITSARQQKAIDLLNEWLNDESGYDEEAWPDLKTELEKDRLSSRKLFV